MEKEERVFKIYFDFNWTDGIEIKKIREDLDMLEQLGATGVQIEGCESYEIGYVNIEAYVKRIETDEEYNARIEVVNKRQEQIKISELAEIERLKLKYGI